MKSITISQNSLDFRYITINYSLSKQKKREALTLQLNQLINDLENESIEIHNKNFDKNKSINKVDKQWLRKVEQIIHSEIRNTRFTVDFLAATLNASRSKVHRQIKRITGLTPNKYIRTIKLQVAKDILENGIAQTVSEVSYAVGFDTPKYFSKIYEQQYGIRPLSYIRN